jgi:hypothetical protein
MRIPRARRCFEILVSRRTGILSLRLAIWNLRAAEPTKSLFLTFDTDYVVAKTETGVNCMLDRCPHKSASQVIFNVHTTVGPLTLDRMESARSA